MPRIAQTPVSHLDIDASATIGPHEPWRHSFGHGGINALPIPPRVQKGIGGFRPRLVRIFLQEFFRIYPRHGTFDFSRLDPYMDALANTSAKIVAALCIKPEPLFPRIDESQWRPSDAAEWQRVVAALVERYSVQRPLVTHWEIGNEVDIGEMGGCPYLITDPAAYTEYYRLTIEPILKVFPGAKVGGPGNASAHNPPMEGFIRACRESGIPLDFVSHHLYSDDPVLHAAHVRHVRGLLTGFPKTPETMVTEFSPGFEPTSTEDQAFEPRRAACVAATIIEMMRAGLDWSFHYHLWDQTCYPDDFAPFYSGKNLPYMLRHWNEIPHRFGLFGVSGEVRPQFFVYQMLQRLGDELLACRADSPDLYALAGTSGGRISVVVANYNAAEGTDRVVSLRFASLLRTQKQLTVYRIDTARRWSSESLELLPLESREIVPLSPYECQVYLPAGTVAMVSLQDLERS